MTRPGRRTPETHPLPPTPTDLGDEDDRENEIPPPLPQRNTTPRPNLSHAHIKDRPRPHDLRFAASAPGRGGKSYLPPHTDRLSHSDVIGMTHGDRPGPGVLSPRGYHGDQDPRHLSDKPDIRGPCTCSACHPMASSPGAPKDCNLRAIDPAFFNDTERTSLTAEGSFTDSAVGLESFCYNGRESVFRRENDLERSRTSSSPASPVPPGGFYHTKHFLSPPFTESNGFGRHEDIDSLKPGSSAQKTLRSRHKKQQGHYPALDQRTRSHESNPDLYNQECMHCDPQLTHHYRHHPNHHNHLTNHQHQHKYPVNRTHNGLQSPIPEDADNSNERVGRLDHNQNSQRDDTRRQHRNYINSSINNNNRSTNNNNHSCSSSSPERVYYPHSDSTPTSTPTSHLSSDAAAVTSVNLDSNNLSTSSLTSQDNLHNCSNSSGSRCFISKPGQTSIAPSGGRSTSITPRAGSSKVDSKNRTNFLMTSAEVHSPQSEDKNDSCAVTHDQSESQIPRSSKSPANQFLTNGSSTADDLENISPFQVSLICFEFPSRMSILDLSFAN